MSKGYVWAESLDQIRDAIENGLSGPVLCIPFGADETTPCRFFASPHEISADDIAALLEFAYPEQDRRRRFHIIQAPPRYDPGPVFYRTVT